MLYYWCRRHAPIRNTHCARCILLVLARTFTDPTLSTRDHTIAMDAQCNMDRSADSSSPVLCVYALFHSCLSVRVLYVFVD